MNLTSRWLTVWAVLASLLVATGTSRAQFADIALGNDLFGYPVRTVWQTPTAQPGQSVVLAVALDIPEPFHINPNPAQVVAVGDFHPYPTTLNVTEAPNVIMFESARFPRPHPVKVSFADGELMVYSGETVMYLPGRVAADAKPGKYDITLSLEYQACDDNNCLDPVTVEIPVTLEIVPAGMAVGTLSDADATLFDGLSTAGNQVAFDVFGMKWTVDASTMLGTVLTLLLAAIGGFLLNLTPCVLPVIPIKIIGLSQAAGNRSKLLMLGTIMSLGVIAFWIGLGAAITISARFLAPGSGITATNQLFQYPAFTIGVGIIIALMAVGMCGLFAVRLPNFVYSINPRHDSFAGSFGFGVMTAVLSTPCTAPFMGAAAAWAATENPGVALSVFAAVGVGMALPYQILSMNPRLVDRMPRTGPASELIKQVMGLLMLAAALYFIGTGVSGLLMTYPDPPSRLYWWPVMAMVAVAGGWLAYRTLQITPSVTRRAIFCSLGVLAIVGSVYGGISFTDRGPVNWTYYSPERFADARKAGNVVVLDFTAEWCINCKTLEHGVLYQDAVAKLLNSEGVTAMKVDITGYNPPGREKLREMQRLTIPLLVIYSPDGREVLKTDAYTPDQVIAAIEEARSADVAGNPSQESTSATLPTSSL